MIPASIVLAGILVKVIKGKMNGNGALMQAGSIDPKELEISPKMQKKRDTLSLTNLGIGLLTSGAAFIGKLVGFYPFESGITAGLCMSNMGGTGDVAVLSAAKRMELMPFAQISSRLGGAIILLLASLMLSVLSQFIVV